MNLPSLSNCNQIAAQVFFYFYLDNPVILSHLHMNGLRTEMCFHCVRAFYILSVLFHPFTISHLACCCVFYIIWREAHVH